MPTRTHTTPDQLREQANSLAEQAAEAQAAVDELAAEEHAREQKAQAERDRALLATFSAAALDKAVDDAARHLDEVVAELPVTQALATHLAAQWRRNWAFADMAGARGRLGLDTANMRKSTEDVVALADQVARTAQRLAQDQINVDRSQS